MTGLRDSREFEEPEVDSDDLVANSNWNRRGAITAIESKTRVERSGLCVMLLLLSYLNWK